MRSRLAVWTGMAFAMAVGPVLAEKPLKDYSHIRGVNHGMQGDEATIRRDLGYGKRINLNSTRIWLNYQGYEKDPKGYIERLRNYVRIGHSMGYSTMPILTGSPLRDDLRGGGRTCAEPGVHEIQP